MESTGNREPGSVNRELGGTGTGMNRNRREPEPEPRARPRASQGQAKGQPGSGQVIFMGMDLVLARMSILEDIW